MAKGDIQIVHRDGKWLNEVEGGDRASNSAAAKADAQAEGRDMARERKVEHLIHNLGTAIARRAAGARAMRIADAFAGVGLIGFGGALAYSATRED